MTGVNLKEEHYDIIKLIFQAYPFIPYISKKCLNNQSSYIVTLYIDEQQKQWVFLMNVPN